MQRRTKIVATLGPATKDAKTLERLIDAGVDVVRLNFSHGTADEHTERADLVRTVARAHNRSVGVLVDLQGPKIRVGKFEEGKVNLKAGDPFILDAECKLGTQQRVGLDYKELPGDVRPGDTLLLSDGLIVLSVEKVQGAEIHCRVETGGVLSNNKGINRKGGGLTAPALTEKDMADIRTAAALRADYLAVSFPRNGDDVRLARRLLQEAGGRAMIIAKIERAEAIPALEDILEASDGIMVARGDLAIEVGDAAVPGLQKRMIRAAMARNRLTITATQMMESMINNPMPTRAEVSDVANAVLDGTDAIMLSAESATGQYPVETVQAVARVCVEAEKEQEAMPPADIQQHVGENPIAQAIAQATLFTAHRLNVRAIASLTQTGSTALWMSRHWVGAPIYALTPVVDTRRRVTLFKGVHPINFKMFTHDPEELLAEAERELKRRGLAEDGDLVIFSMGEPIGKAGGTNTMKIVRVGEHRKA